MFDSVTHIWVTGDTEKFIILFKKSVKVMLFPLPLWANFSHTPLPRLHKMMSMNLLCCCFIHRNRQKPLESSHAPLNNDIQASRAQICINIKLPGDADSEYSLKISLWCLQTKQQGKMPGILITNLFYEIGFSLLAMFLISQRDVGTCWSQLMENQNTLEAVGG